MAIERSIDEQGNSVYIVDANQDITLATANTYLDKNIVIKTKFISGKDINITDNVISVATEWNIAEFDTNYMKTHDYIGIEAPSGYVIDKILFTVYWYGNAAAAAQTVYGGFYKGKNIDSSMAQVLRNNGTNRMGAGWITAEINNINDVIAIAFGEAYLYNSNGSASSLLQPVNSYGIGRMATQNDFRYFSFSNWPSGIAEGYAIIKYTVKKGS